MPDMQTFPVNSTKPEPSLEGLSSDAIPATWADIVILLDRNQLAAAQLQAITWRRVALELSAKLLGGPPSVNDHV